MVEWWNGGIVELWNGGIAEWLAKWQDGGMAEVTHLFYFSFFLCPSSITLKLIKYCSTYVP
jgi:hypothetical protein